MNKKWAIGAAGLTLAILAAAGGQALAMEWHPSRTQSEVGLAEDTLTTPAGDTISVVVGPSTDASGVIQQLQDLDGMHIQVTSVSMTLAANDAIHAANPGLSSEQLAGLPTNSGLPYEVNGMLNNLYHQIFSADTVEHLLELTAPDAAAEFETVVGEGAGQYTPIALYHVGASPQAEAAIAAQGSVRVAVSVPGVADDTRLAAVCWDHSGKSRVTEARVSNGVVYLTVHGAGPVMIMARVQTDRA